MELSPDVRLPIYTLHTTSIDWYFTLPPPILRSSFLLYRNLHFRSCDAIAALNSTTLAPAVHLSDKPMLKRFTDLPLEVRNMIWTMTANIPPNLDVRVSCRPVIEDYSRIFNPYTFISPQPDPALLFINRESRYIASRYYRLAFTTYLDCGKSTYHGNAQIWINKDMERICLTGAN